jgi:hypothetical protein
MINSVTPIISSRFIQPVSSNGRSLTIDMDQQTRSIESSGNGILKIEKTGTSGLVDTYTITFVDGTIFDYYITNGQDGAPVSVSTYSGSYRVAAKVEQQVISTSNKLMTEDFIIDGISYTTVPNEKGYSFIIGDEMSDVDKTQNYNQIIFGDEILINLTDDTVASDKLFKGVTAHDADGNIITGTAEVTVDNNSLIMPAGLISINN